jgi:quercetin dioxygenase-like cupin family protein
MKGEELLHVLEGAVEVTLPLNSGPTSTQLNSGSIFGVPKAVWRFHAALAATFEFSATPGKSEHSTAADPRAV